MYKKVFETEWFSIDSIQCESSNNRESLNEPLNICESRLYYRLSCDDCVSIIAKTIDKKIILAHQYRPAIESFTLEFPAGYVDKEESPEDSIKRELKEETGFLCDSIIYMGQLKISPSRINNTLYTFFGVNARPTEMKEDNNIESILITEDEFVKLIVENKYIDAGSMAIFLLAKLKGYL